MKTIEQSVKFAASADTVYSVYMDPRKHAKAIGGSAQVSKKVGSLFSAWDGYCRGKILHLEPGKLIVQTWRASDWRKADPDSVLILAFMDRGNGSELRMVHANVPDEKADELAEGWKEHYWAPFKDYLRGT